jgi:uncharacterized protein YbcV (DUF1398 family)
MSLAIENLQRAQSFAMSHRPKVGGFPFLAEVLRKAGVTRNLWYLPSCQSIYLTKYGPIVSQMPSLVDGLMDIPRFDPEALMKALREDQAGRSGSRFLQEAFSRALAAKRL